MDELQTTSYDTEQGTGGLTVHMASDHAGFEYKEAIRAYLEDQGYDVVDHGAYEYDADDDYPDFVAAAARAVSENPTNNRGIIFGGSGQGEAMVANRFPGVRAVVFYGGVLPMESLEMEGTATDDVLDALRLTRKHNDANMLSIAARFVDPEFALDAVMAWLEFEFEGGERHLRRIKKIDDIEI